MTTATPTSHVEQLVLPGQSAAPEGPVDLIGMYLMHHALRRDLDAFVTAAGRTPAADRTTWVALERRWDRFSRILHHHHSGEDVTLWPLLLARVDAAGDVAGRATLEAMEAEHEEIDPLLTACREGFNRLAAVADDDARAALQVRLGATRERLGQHLGHEERDAMALVQRNLTAAEWHALDAEFGKHYSTADKKFALPWVLHGLVGEGRRRAVGFVGRPVYAVWWLFMRRPFERRERRLFG